MDSPPPDRSEPAPPHNHRLKSVSDEQGRIWVIHEEPPDPYDRRRHNALIFRRAEVVRRVRFFPENWFDLPDAELLLLSERIGRQD